MASLLPRLLAFSSPVRGTLRLHCNQNNQGAKNSQPRIFHFATKTQGIECERTNEDEFAVSDDFLPILLLKTVIRLNANEGEIKVRFLVSFANECG